MNKINQLFQGGQYPRDDGMPGRLSSEGVNSTQNLKRTGSKEANNTGFSSSYYSGI
jgi:hypothetical protein